MTWSQWKQSFLESVGQDVRYGLRALRRTPGFTAIAVASLAIGIGANTTMFGAIDALFVRNPAHVTQPERIHRIYFEFPNSTGATQPVRQYGYGTYEALRDNVEGFDAVGAFATQKTSSGRGADARSLDAGLVTPSVLTMLGVRPALGRFFAPNEELDDADHVAVLGYEMWRSRFGGKDDVLGRTIDVAGTPYVIIGVAPEGFTGINLDRIDLWLPLGAANRLYRARSVGPRASAYFLELIGRRRADVSAAQIGSEVTGVYRESMRGSPRYEETYGKTRALLAPIVDARGPLPNSAARVSTWVAAVSVLVLLIACANVANLLLLRGLTRSREVAVRLSLGATRWRLTRQWLVEGALLALAGAACALILARWTASAMRAFLLPTAGITSVFDLRLLAFTAVVALGTGILASLVPALITTRRDFGPLLGGGRSPGSPQRLALQRGLIGVQVAFATLLLVGAGLFVTSLRNVRAIDLGLDADRLLYIWLDGSSMSSRGQARAAANATYMAMLERVRQVPGVAHATVTSGEPLNGAFGMVMRRRGGPPLTQGSIVPLTNAVGSDFFATMGTTLRRGRFFTATDHVRDAHVIVIDEETAKQYWPVGEEPLGSCVYLGSDTVCSQVVGIVANAVFGSITGKRPAMLYMPFESWADMSVSMMEVRTVGDPRTLIPAIRQAVLTVSPDLPWVDVRSVGERLQPQLRPWRLGASMFTTFGILALSLAAVGLYGLLSYIVAQRRHEIGIRKALGAPQGQVVLMVLRGSMAMTLTGVAVGLLGALAAGRLISSQLYGVSPRDPAVFLVCIVTLVAVSIAACLIPARRASSVDPMVALRAE